MQSIIHHCEALLERAPAAFHALLDGLPEELVQANEGEGTWSAAQVMAHLVHCERQNWIVRVRQLLAPGGPHVFIPLNREGGLERAHLCPIQELTTTFTAERCGALLELRGLRITGAQLQVTALHPDFGTVTLRQLLSAWTAHDLSHLAQVSRILAHQLRKDVGPWSAYLRVLNPGVNLQV